MYSEEQPGDAATALFIKKLSEEDAGEYRCTATYASNQQLEASVDISVYSEYFQVKNILTFLIETISVGITWEDAPMVQYASLQEDYKVRCVVRANPPANIDWLKESLIISTGRRTLVWRLISASLAIMLWSHYLLLVQS